MSEKIGEYQVLGALGKGAHSTILHIRRAADHKAYAMKIVPIDGPEDLKFLEQAEHEYRISLKLDHPNLTKVSLLEKKKSLGFLGSVKEVRLLVEYVKGKTLDSFKIIPIPKLAQIFLKVSEGLMHMHRRGICHADLKPNNIMLTAGGEVKILDFGLAWIKGEAKNRVQGTPEYMAPEQIQARTVNESTDIFNFGATLYRLVTFRHIPSLMPSSHGISQTGKTWTALLKPVKVLNPNCPEPLGRLIEHCIAYQAHQRPESMGAVRDELAILVQQLVKKEEDKLENWNWVDEGAAS